MRLTLITAIYAFLFWTLFTHHPALGSQDHQEFKGLCAKALLVSNDLQITPFDAQIKVTAESAIQLFEHNSSPKKGPSRSNLYSLMENLPVLEIQTRDRQRQIVQIAAGLTQQSEADVTVRVLQADQPGEAEVYLVHYGAKSFIMKLFVEPEDKGIKRFIREVAASTRINRNSNQNEPRAPVPLGAKRVKIDGRIFPALISELAVGKSLESIIQELTLAENSIGIGKFAITIGEQIARFHRANSKEQLAPKDFKEAYAKIRDEHFVKFERWFDGDAEGPSTLQTLQENQILYPSEVNTLKLKLQDLLASYKSNMPTSLGLIHGDLKPANLFFDPVTGRVTLIDNETLAKNWSGLADPIEDLARLYEGVARQGVKAGLPLIQIRRIQEGILRGYLIESGLLFSSIQPAFDFYRARYLGVLLRRSNSQIDRQQARELIAGLTALTPYKNSKVTELITLWETEKKDLEDIELPESLLVRIGRQNVGDLYRLVIGSWNEVFNSETFVQAMKRIRKNSTIDEPALAQLKLVRKRARLVRTAFQALDVRHEVPAQIHEFVKVLGKLCDRLENGVTDKVGELAEQLEELGNGTTIEKLMATFRPSSEKGISNYINESTNEILKLSIKRSLSADQFHDLRKEISRLQQVFRISYINNSEPKMLAYIEYMQVINWMTRRIHDRVVKDHLKGKTKYSEANILIPNQLREMVTLLGTSVQTGEANPELMNSRFDRLAELLSSSPEDYDNLDIPESIILPITKGDAFQMFNLAYEFWENNFDEKATLFVLNEVNNRGIKAINSEQVAYLKRVRKNAMLLRYLFTALDQNHKPPKRLDNFVKGLGKVVDGITNGIDAFAKYDADLVIKLIRAKELKGISDQFVPASHKSIQSHFAKLIADIQSNLRLKTLPAKVFHQVRKDLRQVQATLRMIQVLEPTRNLQEIIARTHKLNEETGKMHDLLVSQVIAGEVDYENSQVEIPSELAFEIDRILLLAKF